MRILLVKTSSLGDVVHNLPVVVDIRNHFPDAQIDWVVEENFATIPRLNPGVNRVIPVAMRRWRKHLSSGATWRQWREFKQSLQEQDYDFVIDTQGLLKSSLIARSARGLRCGYDWGSAREPMATFSYHRKFAVAKNLHAVERNRQLAAQALGYEASAAPTYGVRAPEASLDKAFQAPYVLFLHATSRADKEWPEANWIELGKWFAAQNLAILLASGNEQEFVRAVRLASAIPGAIAQPPGTLENVARHLANAAAIVGVDTGLTHLACAFGKPTVAIYCQTDPGLTGVYGSPYAINLGEIGATPRVNDVISAYEKVRAS